jgi:hypothetical protein
LPSIDDDAGLLAGQASAAPRRSISLRVVTDTPRFKSVPGVRKSDSLSDLT